MKIKELQVCQDVVDLHLLTDDSDGDILFEYLTMQLFDHYGRHPESERNQEYRELVKWYYEPEGAFLAYAKRGNTIVGTSFIRPVRHTDVPEGTPLPNGFTLYVGGTYVAREYWECGLGTELYLFAEEQAKQLGVKYLILHTHPFLNGAVHFWKKHGYEVFQDRKDSWGTLDMMKVLGESCES